MESSLTESEMDAVLQLIQLSGNSADEFHVFWVKFPPEKEEIKQVEDDEIREESVGETSSAAGNSDKSVEEALPRRRKKFLPIGDVYRRSEPLINNRTQKRRKV